MRQPKARRTPIDDARLGQWLECFAGYRVHVSRARIDKWLEQFQKDHRDVAARVLDAVDFYREDHLTHAYRTLFGQIQGWSRKASERKGRWRFVAFSTHAGESGDRMLHTFKVATGLAARRFEELFIHRSELLSENLTSEDTVVFVDDFAGTGDQAINAWNESLSELLPARPRIFLILAVAVETAIAQIGQKTPILVQAFKRLRSTDNFFASECSYFSGAEKTSVLHYCTVADPLQPRGYERCGLLLVFAHRCPNNSLPILHAKRQEFRGLFPR